MVLQVQNPYPTFLNGLDKRKLRKRCSMVSGYEEQKGQSITKIGILFLKMPFVGNRI